MSGSPQELADGVVRDLREGRSFRLVESVGTDLDLAYRIQDAVTARLQSDRREVGGYKLAFNKQASFDYYGLAEPCSAPIFADQISASGTRLRLDAHRQFVIEPEIAVILGADLPGQGVVTPDQVRQAIGYVVAAFELMDVRGAFDLDPSAAQAVAQGIYNVGAVLGATRLDLGELDIAALPATLSLGSAPPLSVVGGAPQHPVDAVCWLANHLAKRGQALKAGMIVLCGTHLSAQTIAKVGDVYLDMGPLGGVELSVT